MRKLVLCLTVICALSTTIVSCRETKETRIEVETEDVADNIDDDVEDAIDDTEDAIEEGVDEVKENTGLGGDDDN